MHHIFRNGFGNRTITTMAWPFWIMSLENGWRVETCDGQRERCGPICTCKPQGTIFLLPFLMGSGLVEHGTKPNLARGDTCSCWPAMLLGVSRFRTAPGSWLWQIALQPQSLPT